MSKQKVCWGIGKFAGGNLDVMRENEKDFKKLLNRKESKIPDCKMPQELEEFLNDCFENCSLAIEQASEVSFEKGFKLGYLKGIKKSNN